MKNRVSHSHRLNARVLIAGMSNHPPYQGTAFFLQMSFLLKREVREFLRDKNALGMRFFVNGFMAVLFSLVFTGIGNKDDETGGLAGHFGAVCNMMMSTFFTTAQPLLLQFPLERPVFLREYGANMYGTTAYFLSKTILELPVTLLSILETWLIAYWTMGLSGNFFELILISWILGLNAASLSLCVGCSVTNAQSAQELAPLVLVPQMLFTGIFIPISLVPKWLRWIQYMCSLKYAINLGCIVEFADSDTAKEFLTKVQGINEDEAGTDVLILLAIFCGFRLLAMLALRRKASFVF